jgi:cob(I)alamin adenosyltransferase
VVTLAGVDLAPFQNVVTYLNRLSDYLFVAARAANQAAGEAEIPWDKPA